MTSSTLQFMSIPAIVALGGGVLAVLWHPSREARSLVQHFAAGVVLAALAVELLPEIGREHVPGLVLAAAFALGSFFMFVLKVWTIHGEDTRGEDSVLLGVPSGLLLATFLDVAVDHRSWIRCRWKDGPHPCHRIVSGTALSRAGSRIRCGEMLADRGGLGMPWS
jgi:ZIP family zinc transporter